MSTFPSPPPPQRRRQSMIRCAALACAGVFLLGACSSGGGSDSIESPGESADRSTPSDEGSGAAEAAGAQDGARAPVSTAALDEHKVERRGALTLTSKDVRSTRAALVATVDDVGGYLADERSQTGDDGKLARSSLRLVVPTDEFDTAMAGLAEAGTVVSQRQTSRDVTEQVADVESRVESAEASLRRVRLLLGRAEKLGDVIQLEAVLGERQADLESLQARQQSLAKRTDTATIEISVKPSSGDGTSSGADDTGFLAGLAAGWDALRSTWDVLVTVVGAVLPLAVALGAPVAALVWLVRRALRRREYAPPAESD